MEGLLGLGLNNECLTSKSALKKEWENKRSIFFLKEIIHKKTFMFRSCVPGCADGAGSQGAGGGRQHSGGNTWPGRQRLSKLSGVLFVFIVGIACIPLPGSPDYAISFELHVQN